MKQTRSGFSLLELSVVLLIIGAVTGGTLAMGVSTIDSARRGQTNNKLNIIEDAIMTYRTVNNRLPCPADATMTENDVNSGVEAAIAGTCTGSTPAANFVDAINSVVEGAVPFKTLGLPQEFMYDGWGRKFAYAVNRRVTAPQAMVREMLADGCNITVLDAAGGMRSNAGAIYLLMSYGPDGHGGYLRSGSRFGSGSTDADELTNCHCNSVAVGTAYSATYVQKDPTATFDDFVRYKERWQMQSGDDGYLSGGASACNPQDGFRADGAVPYEQSGWIVAHGDINGDGLQDLVVLGTGDGGGHSNGHVYVLFGKPGGYANPTLLGSLNGTDGFSLSDDTWHTNMLTLAVGDLDHDGYDDVAIGTGYHDVYVYYGHAPPFNAHYDVGAMTACQGVDIYNGSVSPLGMVVAAGDVNGDGIADLIMSEPGGNSNKGKVYVLFGKTGAKSCPNTGPFGATVDPTALSSASNPKGSVISGPSATGSFGVPSVAVGDFNHDGYGDVLITDPVYNAGGQYGRVYVVFGQASWPSTVAAGSLAGSGGSPAGIIFYKGTNGPMLIVTVGDATGDGIPDILAGSGWGEAWLIKGKANPWNPSYDVNTMVGSGTAYRLYDSGGGSHLGSWLTIADVNKDGVGDLMLGDYSATSYGSTYLLLGPITAGRDLHAGPPVGGSDGTRFDCSYPDTDQYGRPNCGGSFGGVDLNGDGIGDVIIGVQGGNPAAGTQAGYTYVYYGMSSGWPATYSLSTIK